MDIPQQNNPPMKSDALLDFNKRRHASARNMAWTSLIFTMGLIVLILFKVPPEFMANYDGLFMYLFFLVSSIVLGYLGFTTWGTNEFLKKGNVSLDGQSSTPPNPPAG